ncbi:MAG TPA: LysR family transcriptional regulator [Burkholderiaceae bacterium]|nr:LysR family transcriptional regulator [Burkholderiaceae bacterium]
MDRFKQLQTFVAVAAKGSLSAVAAAEDVAPAIISRRMDALEARLGVRLLVRTTRKITLTDEGSAFLDDAQRILAELENAESSVAEGGARVSGHLRVTAPAGFGRRHVAPLVPRFIEQHPHVSITLDLSDRLVDLVNEGFDCAIRIGHLSDSSLIGVRLADNRRVVVASPAYIAQHGEPKTPDDLLAHHCLGFGVGSQQRAWTFRVGKTVRHIKVHGPMECSDATVLTTWAREGHGLAWRSLWEVGEDLRSGALVEVLADYAAPDNGVFAVFAQRKHLPARVRAWVDMLRTTYNASGYW